MPTEKSNITSNLKIVIFFFKFRQAEGPFPDCLHECSKNHPFEPNCATSHCNAHSNQADNLFSHYFYLDRPER